MIYGSVCSGIEAASAAWHSLGWKAAFVSEIEKFPSQVLAHHYPDVPNLGDMTKYKEWADAAIDVLVGGTPCQSFSVAGLRGGLDDSRGNLMLTYAEIAHRYRSYWLVWENVPGCLSSAGGADFASLLAVLSGRAVVAPAGGWKNTGIVPGVEGAYGLAWRVLDAQYFGVPQRRRRVFVVGCLGGWQRAAAVLLERESLLRNPPPRREAGKRIAGTVKGGSGSRGYPDPSDGNGGGIVGPLEARHAGGYQSAQSAQSASAGHLVANSVCMSSGQANAEISVDRAPTLNCLHEAPVVAFKPSHYTRGKDGAPNEVAPPLSADADKGDQDTVIAFAHQAGGAQTTLGYDPESGTAPTLGRCQTPAIAFDTTQITSKANRSNPQAGDPSHPLAAGAHPPAIAFSAKDYGADASADASADVSPTLRSMGHSGSHANGGGQVAVAAFKGGQGSAAGGIGYDEHVSPTLGASPSGSNRTPALMQAMQVRRLTPMECERLQGFPDNYTLIPIPRPQMFEGQQVVVKMSADGPRYKALGNSMAVPVMHWIGRRIDFVSKLEGGGK